MLSGIVFDMDGVIVNSHPAHEEAWREFLHSLGKDVSEAELAFIFDGHKREEILRYFLGDLSPTQFAEYGRLKDRFFRRKIRNIRPISGLMEFLLQVENAGVPAAVATSASQSRTRSTLDRLRLTRRFNVIVTGNDVLEGKPDPSIYRLACCRLNAAPENTMAIEDAVSGIQSAKSAGLKCVGIVGRQSAEKLRAAGADHTIKSFVGLSLAELENLVATA
jgi:HAD superfamily hydrolase (TIGR01509 family)